MEINTADLGVHLALARDVACEVGKHLRENQESLSATQAEIGRDIKAVGDKEAETRIIARLHDESPFPVFSEEAGWVQNRPADSGEAYWIVDPLDGTYNYTRGIPIATVSIALVRDLDPLAGVVFDFHRDEMFSGAPEMGARVNETPMQVSDITDPSQASLNTGLPVRADFTPEAMAAFGAELGRWRKVRMLGSAALSLAYVAAGRADLYREDQIMFWDVAAGIALVRATGGSVNITVTDLMKPVYCMAGNSAITRAVS